MRSASKIDEQFIGFVVNDIMENNAAADKCYSLLCVTLNTDHELTNVLFIRVPFNFYHNRSDIILSCFACDRCNMAVSLFLAQDEFFT